MKIDAKHLGMSICAGSLHVLTFSFLINNHYNTSQYNLFFFLGLIIILWGMWKIQRQ